MRVLDAIYRKRLKRISEELDCYLQARLSQEDVFLSDSFASGVSDEKKKSNIQEKLLSYSYMSMNDEVHENANYVTDSDMCAMSQADEHRHEKKVLIQAQREASFAKKNSAIDKPVGTVIIPEFSRKNEKYGKLDQVLEKKEETFSEMLLRLIDEKGLKDSDAYKRANIDRRLFSKIRGDKDYLPSKKTAISFCLALQLKMDEAKKLLATAGYTLSMSSRFDLIIMYLIENCEYNIHFANIVLNDYGVGTLSKP